MLAIRLQRIGRQGYPVYRVAVQESQRHPSSGRVVAYVGAYNPHTKETKIDAEKVGLYLKNGAQPTPRVVKLLVEQKIKLPDWVKIGDGKKTSKIRHAEKLRKNQPSPAQTSEEVSAGNEEPAEAPAAEEPAVETPVEKTEE